MRRNIILLTGPAGSGKTTIAMQLVEHYRFIRIRFAQPIKQMLAFGFGLTADELDGHLKELPCDKLCGVTPRLAQQTLGTEWGRVLIHHDLWAHAWKTMVEDHSFPGAPIVADDCRFPNESDAARQIGITTVVRLERQGAGIPGSHPSEQGVPFDFVVSNNGTPNQIARVVYERSFGRSVAA